MALIQVGRLTTEEKKQKTRDRLVRSMESLYGNMRAVYEQNFRAVWSNPDGLTPQEVMDAFGTDAVEFFSGGVGLYRYLDTVVPGGINLPAPSEVTPHGDGTVTIGQLIESSSSSSSASSEDVGDGPSSSASSEDDSSSSES